MEHAHTTRWPSSVGAGPRGLIPALALLGLAGCPSTPPTLGGDSAHASTDDSTGGPPGAATGHTSGAATTQTPSGDSHDITTTGGDETTSFDADDTTGGNPGTDDGPAPLPDGGQCAAHDECESGRCFDLGILGGICGECVVDADCPAGGCTAPSATTQAPAVCNAGELGGGCETTDACTADLVCTLVLDVANVLATQTCGECGPEAACPGNQTCQPVYDVAATSGYWACVELGSLPNGSGCDLDGGNAACASGICATASYAGIAELGVCSECAGDEDCPGVACLAPEIDLARGLVAGVCEGDG
ncbi:MAG: hypothetical protein AAF721_03715 [Myxococcota bacterium]